MPAERKRKPCEKPGPYGPRKKPKPSELDNLPATSVMAWPSRENLTLHDWMTVLKFIDLHPDLGQADVVKHFQTKKDGALIFTQSTLSRKLKMRSELEERVQMNPNSLSSKCPRVVTRPDVECALVLWLQQMELKGETVSRPMLQTKRQTFEERLGVPEGERLTGDGWIASFCKTYKIKERRRHGEAASINPATVEAEQVRVHEILAAFAPRDRWNFDEIGLFAFAPPDRGLAMKQMRGKKKDKFRLTLGFACNADGSEKAPPIYIGKARKPRCFKKRTPEQYGLYYRSNKKAWMTGELFEEWIKELDIKMRLQNRRICLIMDNFSAHNISYEPTNIQLEWFTANLTSHVQPLDAGIIRCFKAYYRHTFCLRALELDDAGESDIYKINLLEAMLMAKEAWNTIEPRIIKNCWEHTGIQCAPIKLRIPQPTKTHQEDTTDEQAWVIIQNFATSDMTLPNAKEALKDLLGDVAAEMKWQAALNAVMDAEGDVTSALAAINELRLTSNPDSAPPTAEVEHALMGSVTELKKRNRIHGKLLTIEDLVNPPEEKEVGEGANDVGGGDGEIVDQVNQEMESGERSEPGSDDDDDEGETHLGPNAIVELCRKLEACCLYIGGDCALELSRNLHRLRAQLRQEQMQKVTQKTLDAMWGLRALSH